MLVNHTDFFYPNPVITNAAMKAILRMIAAAFLFAAVSCDKSTPTSEAAPHSSQFAEMETYRSETRQHYNNRRFAKLEEIADKTRSGKERLADGGWKIIHFYESLLCHSAEPENMWRLHDEIHKDWIKAYPESITARVAHADFLTSYAWHARTDKFANEVTEEGWKLFRERLAAARTVLDEAKPLAADCPKWWHVFQKVALGQGWPRDAYESLFKEAKAFEPEFYEYDIARAHFLLPRWYGEPGEWAKEAEARIPLQGATGHAIYARVVWGMSTYCEDLFGESKASWRKARQGFEDLRKSYPDSPELLNQFCRIACLAGDRKQAKILLTEIDGKPLGTCWYQGEFERAQAWANSGKDGG